MILVRERVAADSRWETFMVRRPVRSEFAADVFVFPGGKVEEGDYTGASALRSAMGWPHDAPDRLEFRIAAIRELFEEAGALVASGASREVVSSTMQSLRGNANTFTGALLSPDFRFDASALHPFAHWITPDTMPRRYDTWFYVALLPTGQWVSHDGSETVESAWIQPAEALRRSDAGSFPLVFVTRRLLERMAAFGSVDELIHGVNERDLEPVIPKSVCRNGRQEFLVPGDPEY